MRHLLFLFIVMIALLMSCDGRQAGGPSSVETQNSIAGILKQQDGTPAVGALMRVFRADAVMTQALVQDTTDSLGHYDLQVPQAQLYSVDASTPDGRVARSLRTGASVQGIMELREPHRIYLAIDSGDWAGHSILQVALLGSDQSWMWNSDTALAVALATPGVYTFQIMFVEETREFTFSVDSLSDTLHLAGTFEPSVLLTNFESICNSTNLSYIWGSSWLFLLQGTATTQENNSDVGSMCESDSVFGQSLHIPWEPKDSMVWMAGGITLAPENEFINLQNLDSVVFYARGSGEMSLGFITKNMMTLSDYGYPKFAPITLTSEWVRYSLATSTLKFADSSVAAGLGYTWKGSSLQTSMLQWSASTSVDIWLDEIRFYGVTLFDLRPAP